MDKNIGFVGLGAMGWPMASNLVKGGFVVIAFDARAGEAERFAREVGGKPAASLKALGQASEAVVTMLPTSNIVDTVLLGPDGVASGLRAGSVVIEMSSGVPTDTVSIAKRLADGKIELVDAPVSGGVKKAATGELAIMVGGSEQTVERVKPVLQAMGQSITHSGAIGTGQAMKALNNLVSAGGFLIGIEALLVGKKFGLEPGVMVDILNASTGMNNSTRVKFKQFVLSGAWNSGFALDLMVKDIGIALDVADALDVDVPLSKLCHSIWKSAQSDLGSGHDHTEVAKFAAKTAQVALP